MNQLPPSYIEPTHVSTWLLDIFNSPFGLPCVCGDQTSGHEQAVVRPYITRICQREDNPCMVEVSFHLGTAQGTYYFQSATSGFSVDTTNGVNGNWFELRPETSDPGHNPALNHLSYAGTNTVDASWAYSFYDPSNPLTQTSDPCVPNYTFLGIPVHTFVFDMCDHISSWLSEPRVSFRLTFDKIQLVSPQGPRCAGIR